MTSGPRSDPPDWGPMARPFASAWRRAHLTDEERLARGKSARREAPRSTHGRWERSADRPDPIALLEEQAGSRVPELVPIRYGRMSVSPFTFYRGASLIMATDLAATPRSGITVQLCGDAHLSNFGVFGTPERQMVFDVNDFDETLPGPWEWDVKRLAASFEVGGRDRGFAAADRRAIVMAGVNEYRTRMRRSAELRTLDAWYEHLEVGTLLDQVRAEQRLKRVGKVEVRGARRIVAEARARDSVRVLSKRAARIGGELRFRSDPPLIVPIENLDRARLGVGATPGSSSRSCSTPTGEPWGRSIIPSRSSDTSTRLARSSGSEASGPAATSSCWSVATNVTLSSSR